MKMIMLVVVVAVVVTVIMKQPAISQVHVILSL